MRDRILQAFHHGRAARGGKLSHADRRPPHPPGADPSGPRSPSPFCLFVWLWHAADGAEATRRLAAADPWWLLAALAVLSLQTVLSALRWRLTAGQLGILIDRATAVREYYLSQIVNQALPGGMLGDAGRPCGARAQAGLLASGTGGGLRTSGGPDRDLRTAGGSLRRQPRRCRAGSTGRGWLLGPVAGLVAAGLSLPLVLWAVARAATGAAGTGTDRAGARFPAQHDRARGAEPPDRPQPRNRAGQCRGLRALRPGGGRPPCPSRRRLR